MRKLFQCKQIVCRILGNPATRIALIALLAVIPVLAAADPFTAPITAVETLVITIARVVGVIAIIFGGIQMAFGNHRGTAIMEMLFGVAVMAYAQPLVTWLFP